MVNAASEIPTTSAVGIACGNTLSAVFGDWMLMHSRFQPQKLDRVQDVLSLTCIGGLCASTIAASIGVSSLFTGVAVHPGVAWRLWWLGDALGILIVTPLLLTFGTLRVWSRAACSIRLRL